MATGCKRITFKRPSGRAVKVTRCDDRKLSTSAAKRFTKVGACRDERKRFARCDSESPAPAAVRRQLEADQRAAERRAELEARALNGKLCFRTKAAMTKAFKEANLHVTQSCQRDPTGQEFDPVNHRYDRAGKRLARSCDDAIRIASPTRKPYCLDLVDLGTLNELDVARQRGGFRLPPAAQDALTEREARARYAEQAADDDGYGPRPGDLGEDDE